MCDPANFKGLNFIRLTKNSLLVDDDAGHGAPGNLYAEPWSLLIQGRTGLSSRRGSIQASDDYCQSGVIHE
jgi:hypothetical protein